MLGLVACGADPEGEANQDNFDRKAMLVHWADHIIVPAYTHYQKETDALNKKTEAFVSSHSTDDLVQLRNQWKATYLAWQHVAMFEIGQAEAIGLQSYTNMYPTDAVEIEKSITSGVYNLELPSRRNQQGLPAIDYLINGLAETDGEIAGKYNDEAYRKYLKTIVARLKSLTDGVVDDWKKGYRDTFVNNDGSSATGSVNKLTNDYIFYYEKHLRASKVGIPAGVFSSQSTPDAKDVEAYYMDNLSKELYETALSATRNFFNGLHFDDASQSGPGFASYLDYLNSIKKGEDIAKRINDQFVAIEKNGESLPSSFSEQIKNDPIRMINLYDELQKNVLLLKTDMLQALNIRVDYVDADGD